VSQEENSRTIFITGATGYVGKRLTKQFLQRGHRVIVLVRKGSENKMVAGAETVVADPFDSGSFYSFIPKNCVFVQLPGVSHPSPKKAKQFKEIDLRSVKASADAAAIAAASHFIYISVSMAPSKLMAEYQAVRKEGEEYCKNKYLKCTFIRPWYVLGPGHFWPILLLPLYAVAGLVPSWKQKVRAIGLVSIRRVLKVLIKAVEQGPVLCRIMDIKDIRNADL